MDINLTIPVFILPCVKFKMFPPSFTKLLSILSQVGEMFKCTPVITGAAYEQYSKNSYHGKGYAWDIRTRDIIEPFSYAVFIMLELKKVSKRYRILYGDKNHTDHIHVEYRFDIPE